jgi:ATP-binding cassette, subfamily B (MDR/TAP), member 1
MVGQLTNDPVQLQQIMGLNMAIVLTGFFSIVGCTVISFVFGWRLALVNISFTIPLSIFAGFFRLQFEQTFEEMYAKVFAESSKFAAESIDNFRTVVSLTLDDFICQKYDMLLRGHTRAAFRRALYSSIFLAMSDSVPVATQALIFW